MAEYLKDLLNFADDEFVVCPPSFVQTVTLSYIIMAEKLLTVTCVYIFEKLFRYSLFSFMNLSHKMKQRKLD